MLHRIPSGTFRGLTLDVEGTQDRFGLSERELAPSFRRLSRGIKTAIDIGAASGWYTAYFLAKTDARNVIAVEPHGPLIERILSHAARNAGGLARLEVVTACVGHARPDTSDETISLDSLCPRVESPVLVKIDVEGAELDVLRSGASLLGLPDVRLIVETHSALLEAECAALLREHGYTTRVVPNAWWRLVIPETRTIAHNRWLVAHKRLTRP